MKSIMSPALKNAKPIAMYPGTDIEVLGYRMVNAEPCAYIRRSGRISQVKVRYSGHNEAYCSISLNGIRQRMYFNDCRKIMN